MSDRFTPAVDDGVGPLLDGDLGVVGSRRVALVHHGKVIRHSDGPGQSRVHLVGADHRHDGYGHAQIAPCGGRQRSVRSWREG